MLPGKLVRIGLCIPRCVRRVASEPELRQGVPQPPGQEGDKGELYLYMVGQPWTQAGTDL